jgi:hypothetical protein
MSIMRIALRLFLFLMLAICFSCEEQGFFVKCPDCTADEPINAELEVKLDKDYYIGAVIQIYEGNFEDGILLYTYNAHPSSLTFIHKVAINKKYTVTATYNIQNNKYIAVDSATPRVKYDKSQCDDPCFYVYDRICDLRLKYTK